MTHHKKGNPDIPDTVKKGKRFFQKFFDGKFSDPFYFAVCRNVSVRYVTDHTNKEAAAAGGGVYNYLVSIQY